MLFDDIQNLVIADQGYKECPNRECYLIYYNSVEYKIRLIQKTIDCPGQTNIGNDCYPGPCSSPGWCDYCGNAKCCKKNAVDPSGQCYSTEGGTSSYQCVKNDECKGYQLRVQQGFVAGYSHQFEIACSNDGIAKDSFRFST